MATTLRGGGLGKEKRGTSLSNPVIKKSPKPLSSTKTSSSSSPNATKTSSASKSKYVPNYLRPTISSSNDPSKVPKKTILDSPALKPALDRRRSFDRPPPSSQVQKAIRTGPGTHDVKPFRSTSFLSRTTTTPLASSSSPRPTSSERLSARKDGKQESHFSKCRSLRKSTLSNTTTKKDSNKGTCPIKKTPESGTSESSIDYDTRSVDHLANDGDLVNLDNEVESLPEISDMNVSAKELGDPTNIEIEVIQPIEEDHKDIAIEDDHHQGDKLVVDDQVVDEPTVHESESHEHHQDQEKDQTDKHSDEEIVEETIDHQEKIEGGEQNQTEKDAGDKDGANHKESKADPTKALVEEKKEDKPTENKVDKVLEETKTAEEEKQTVSKPLVAATSTIVTAPVKAQPAGKKENQAYNDVIEETATKLRSKKNKVLALAGAFETVISLQDTSKN